ncbi:hypothetical protein B7P43_G06065 [Cryptotermes secundus]|nr:hypothetical protein B7P43_G06065 [Cryptotermes secundus]
MFLAELKESEKAGTLKLDSYKERDSRPRYVRVNTLSLKVRAAMKMFSNEDWKQVCYDRKSEDYSSFLNRVTSLARDEFIQDLHIKELFIFPNKTEFYRHPLYIGGSIILQDKASCLASWLLKPSPGSITLDMCAAPGMKTTHLACLMKNKGTLYAVDSVRGRYETLCKQVEKHGATCVKTLCMDAFQLEAKHCPGVEYILVDPTCSGSGAVEQPIVKNREKFNASRLQSLTRLQSKLLRHALTRFPDVKRIVYSTCSLNIEENEMVVEDVLASVNTDASDPIFEVVDNKLKCKWIHHGSEDFEWGPRCIYTKPDIDLTNGFFIAVIDRVRSDEKNISRNEDEKEEQKHKKRKQLKESKI